MSEFKIYLDGFTIKAREILVSVGIIAVMIALGLAIHRSISIGVQRDIERYTTAVQISDPKQFRYGMDTDFGNALVYGTFEAIDPVSYPEIEGKYIYIRKTKERYTRHTRTVTERDSQGRTHTRTEVYYTWDYAGSEARTCTEVNFLSEVFGVEKFQYPLRAIYLNRGRYLTDGNVRWYYDGVPATFDATIHTELRSGTISDKPEMFVDRKPDEVVSYKLKHQNVPLVIFWVLWILAMGGCVFMFLYAENRWLDDKE